MPDAHAAYLADSVATVGPARLLTMLYDRLLLDLDRGDAALARGDRVAGGVHLAHARDIVAELISSLDVGAWEGGPRLMSIYSFVLANVIQAAATGDRARAAACRDLVAPLAEAWHGAEASLAAQAQARRVAALDQPSDEIGSSMLGVA